MVTNATTIEERAGGTDGLAGPVAALLHELLGVLEAISPDQYTARCGEQFFHGAVGGHVRHCLDHVRALVNGARDGEVDYDHRARGTGIETDPALAREEIRRLIAELGRLDADAARMVLRVVLIPTRDGGAVRVSSTLGRELAFVLSHTVHHNAIVKSMAFGLGVRTPASFGYAPSTLAHQDATACAR